MGRLEPERPGKAEEGLEQLLLLEEMQAGCCVLHSPPVSWLSSDTSQPHAFPYRRCRQLDSCIEMRRHSSMAKAVHQYSQAACASPRAHWHISTFNIGCEGPARASLGTTAPSMAQLALQHSPPERYLVSHATGVMVNAAGWDAECNWHASGYRLAEEPVEQLQQAFSPDI